MVEIDERNTIKAEGYKVSQKGADGVLTVTLANSFRPNGLSWKGGDDIKEMYAREVVIDGDPCEAVIIYRRRSVEAAGQAPQEAP